MFVIQLDDSIQLEESALKQQESRGSLCFQQVMRRPAAILCSLNVRMDPNVGESSQSNTARSNWRKALRRSSKKSFTCYELEKHVSTTRSFRFTSIEHLACSRLGRRVGILFDFALTSTPRRNSSH